MKGQRSGKCLALCMLAWSCLHFAWSDAISSGATFTGAGSIGRGFPSDVTNRTDVRSNLSVQCVTLLPPPYGSYYIEKGTGLSLGSVIVYWCREGYQLVGSEKLACLLRDSTSYWSQPAPHCEAIPKPLDKGFRVAVIASLISGVIILTMSVSFAACCLRDRLLRNSAQQLNTREEQQQGRTCRGSRQADSTNKEMEKQQGAFGKLKHHHRLDYRISALRSSVYPGALAGCSNQGFQRSQENSHQTSMQSLCSEIHVFPQVVLRPGATPSASSMYIHFPQKPGDISLAIMPCHANSPRDIPTAYYRGYEEHKPLSLY
ncbi:uncharacterized protein LOC125630034 [Caretta caretta]|uniref:uncharacterized protein LOC125630034 n=1 Tax=Caretta caretta TaxID=8467 RepID=UPI0020954EB6|nr:sushi domain-containing protein 3-like [Caretta caretta]